MGPDSYQLEVPIYWAIVTIGGTPTEPAAVQSEPKEKRIHVKPEMKTSFELIERSSAVCNKRLFLADLQPVASFKWRCAILTVAAVGETAGATTTVGTHQTMACQGLMRDAH